MFDINELGKSYEQELIWEAATNEQGKHPTVTIEITNEIRKKEARLSSQLGRLEFSVDGNAEHQKAAWINEKLEYCQKMANLCVLGSDGLFTDNGKPAKHSLERFNAALIQSKAFRDWFADALTEAFADDQAILQKKKDDIDRD